MGVIEEIGSDIHLAMSPQYFNKKHFRFSSIFNTKFLKLNKFCSNA